MTGNSSRAREGLRLVAAIVRAKMGYMVDIESGDRLVRRADASDVPALVGLRAEMFRAMGTGDVESSRWRGSAQEWFLTHLDDPRVCIVVVEVDSRVVSAAMAAVRDSIPSPGCPTGGDVLISNVCTSRDARRRGHGQAAFAAVLAWARSTGAAQAELMATGDGQAMYQAAGFAATRYPAMRLSLSPMQADR